MSSRASSCIGSIGVFVQSLQSKALQVIRSSAVSAKASALGASVSCSLASLVTSLGALSPSLGALVSIGLVLQRAWSVVGSIRAVVAAMAFLVGGALGHPVGLAVVESCGVSLVGMVALQVFLAGALVCIGFVCFGLSVLSVTSAQASTLQRASEVMMH